MRTVITLSNVVEILCKLRLFGLHGLLVTNVAREERALSLTFPYYPALC